MQNPFKKYVGPSTLVVAAFIGPGTVTVCTLAGVRSGYMLLWALLFSIIATIILQEMTGRLGITTRQGFGEAIRNELQHPVIRAAGIILVLSAIVIGNAAYEAGNIAGAALGSVALLGETDFVINDVHIAVTPLVIGLIAFCLLFTGNLKVILKFMGGLVALMSIAFITNAVIIGPDVSAILKGMFIPAAQPDELITVIALIGTTVVPYNLFLHASTVRQKYDSVSRIPHMRKENAVAIVLGGIISMSIVITSAAVYEGGSYQINSASDMALQLEPLLGSWAKIFFAIGLFAAGISSAVTAPFAAAFAAKGILGWNDDMKGFRFRAIWIGILCIGVLFSSIGFNPVALIEFAQAANGIFLPLVAVFLLYIMNKTTLLDGQKNSTVRNVFGILVIIAAFFIGFRSLSSVFGFW